MINATLNIECDNCGVEESEELRKDQSPEDAIDDMDWYFAGTLLDRLLCGECYEKEEG